MMPEIKQTQNKKIIVITFALLFSLIGALFFATSVLEHQKPVLPFTIAKKNYEQWLNAMNVKGVSDVTFVNFQSVRDLYKTKKLQQVWLQDFELNEAGKSLIKALNDTVSDSRYTYNYHLSEINRLVAKLTTQPDIATALDLMISDAYFAFAYDALNEKLTPSNEDTDHISTVSLELRSEIEDEKRSFQTEKYSPLDILLSTARLSTDELTQHIAALLPEQEGYYVLRQALHKYQRIAQSGKWHPIPKGPLLQKGDHHIQVNFLRELLSVLGDYHPLPYADHINNMMAKILNYEPEQYRPITARKLPTFDTAHVEVTTPKGKYAADFNSNEKYFFDDALQNALIAFQMRNGLKPSGTLTNKTRAYLNIDPLVIIEKIALNMKRWRQLPESLGERYIFVNMADFSLQLIENEQISLDMKVIIGAPDRRTPLLNNKIRNVVLNPYWNVPHRVAVTSVLPKVQKDIGYLAAHGYKVIKGWSTPDKVIDPTKINWKKLSETNFPYRLKQDPGALNGLGKVKFNINNDYAIFLHDTNEPELFDEQTRALSSGCIRVEKPSLLAQALVKENYDGWNKRLIDKALDRNKPLTLGLKNPVPVYLAYWTAWVDKQGHLQLRDDIYELDPKPEDRPQKGIIL